MAELPNISKISADLSASFRAKRAARQPDQAAEEMILQEKMAAEQAKKEREEYLDSEKKYQDQVDFARASGPLSDPDKEGYIEYARGSGKLSQEEEDKYGYIEFARGAGEIKPQKEKADEKSVEELKAELETKRLEFARADIDLSGRWAKLKRVLGWNVKEIKDSGVDAKKQEYKEALKKYYEAKRKEMGNLTKEQASELFKEFAVDEALTVMNLKNDERVKRNKEKGEWPEKVADKYMQLVNWWRGQSMKTKLAVSGALLVGGVASGLTFGAVGASFFATLGVGYRALSGSATGVGIKKGWDTLATRKLHKKSQEGINAILKDKNWDLMFDANMNSIVGNIDENLAKLEAKDLTRKRVAVYSGLFVGSGVMSHIIQGFGFGGFIRDKIGASAARNIPGGMNKDPNMSAFIKTDPNAGTMLKPNSAANWGTDQQRMRGGSVRDFPRGIANDQNYSARTENIARNEVGFDDTRNRPAGPDTGVNKRAGLGQFYEEKASKFQNPKGVSADNLHGRNNSLGEKYISSKPDAFAKATEAIDSAPNTHGAYPDQIPNNPVIKEIDSGQIGKGRFASLWGRTEQSIINNPEKYGMQNLNRKELIAEARRMTKEMLDEMGQKKGLSYEQLDALARRKVQPDDLFKITKDAYGEFHLDYEGKAFNELKASASGSLAEEMKIDRPKVGPEEVSRVKSGNAEHAGQKAGSRGVGIGDTEDQIRAKQKFADAVQAEQNLKEIHDQNRSGLEINMDRYNLQQYASTKSYMSRYIVEKAGISDYVGFWDRPISSWKSLVRSENYIAPDALQADSVGAANESLEKLRKLYPILRRYQVTGQETIGECLFQAMKNEKDKALLRFFVTK